MPGSGYMRKSANGITNKEDMKTQDTVTKQNVLYLLQTLAANRMESAAINDHIKADAIMEVAAAVEKMAPEDGWNPVDQEPPTGILLILRLEFKETPKRPASKAVGTGTYHKATNGKGYWMHTNGTEIRWPVTGWQLMPSP